MLCLSPAAFAQAGIERPTVGQVVILDADNSLRYAADFPLSALSGISRAGDDLCLEFPAAKLTLKGFFLPLGEWRSLSFSDDVSISGSDFDPEGNFTGRFYSGYLLEKGEGSEKAGTSTASTVTVRLSHSENTVLLNSQPDYGQLRSRALEAVETLSLGQHKDWKEKAALRYEFTVDEAGELVPLRAYTQFNDGFFVSVTGCDVVLSQTSLRLTALSEGRAAVHYKNSMGLELLSLDVRCVDEGGELKVQCICPKCGKDCGGEIHLLHCGHFSCEVENEAEHLMGDCGIVGHCAAEGGHEQCSNCLEYICDGLPHGSGLCRHVHNWVMQSIFSSRCSGCGMVYNAPMT